MARGKFGYTGVYNATPITLEDQEGSALAVDINSTLKTTLSAQLAGEDLVKDIMKVEEQASYLNGTTSQLTATGSGVFFGFVVNSHTSGTLKFWDALTATTPVLLNTITLAAGPAIYTLPAAIRFSAGLYVTVGGTIDYTIVFAQ